MPPEDAPHGEKPSTGSCMKCETKISTTAERCPECGYEPKNGTLSKLLFWLCTLPWVVIFGLFGLAAFGGVLIGSLSLVEFLGGIVALAVLGALPFWHVVRVMKRGEMTATGDMGDEDPGKYGELGGRIGDKLKSIVSR